MTTMVDGAATNARVAQRSAQRLATREKLLEVSVAAFRRRGYAQTDIAAIVEGAGVSRGTFYFHFPTKDDVLAELCLREEIRIVGGVSPLMSADAALEGILRSVVAGVADSEARLGVDLIREICAAQFRPTVVDADSLAAHPLVELVLTAMQRGAAGDPPSKAVDVALIFLTGLFGILSTHNGPSEDRARLIDLLIDLTLKGVTAP